MREEMTKEERALYDARFEAEAWEHALKILEPWAGTAEAIGMPKLTRTMRRATAEAAVAFGRAQDELERLERLEHAGEAAARAAESKTTAGEASPVPRREEYAPALDVAEEYKPLPPRCVQGSATDRRCSRPAAVWRGHSALCEEHARAWDVVQEVNHWGLAEEIAADWLRMAEEWGHEDLVRLAGSALREASRELRDARAKQEEAVEWANRAMVPASGPGRAAREDGPENGACDRGGQRSA